MGRGGAEREGRKNKTKKEYLYLRELLHLYAHCSRGGGKGRGGNEGVSGEGRKGRGSEGRGRGGRGDDKGRGAVGGGGREVVRRYEVRGQRGGWERGRGGDEGRGGDRGSGGLPLFVLDE